MPIIDRLETENKELKEISDGKTAQFRGLRGCTNAKIYQLKEQLKAKDEALEHIIEYWNQDRNDKAMHDALWHIIETAEQALEGDTDGE